MYSVVQLSPQAGADSSVGQNWGYVRRLGYALIQETKVEIGGSKIDEQYGDWLNIWQELTLKSGQVRGHAKMIGDVPELTHFKPHHDQYSMYIPLAYWFNRHNGLALPLIALQYHDVRVTIQYRAATECVNFEGPSLAVPLTGVSMADSYLLIDYVYLDSEERKRFAQASHEYLIEQLQFTGSEALSAQTSKFRLNFNHPSKFLIWVPVLGKYANSHDFLAYADDGDWAAAKERAGKLAWLASRELMQVEDASGEMIIATADGEPSTDAHPPKRAVINSSVLNLMADKVDGQLMFPYNGSNYQADPENVVLLVNDLTSEDMSQLISTLHANGQDIQAFQFFGTAGRTAHSVHVTDAFNYGRFLDRTANPVASAKLQLNGHDRFQERDGQYFNYVQPWQHFSNTPADGINVYSFALKPEDHQPSGTCNFSRIDNATLNVTVVNRNDVSDNDSNLNIYTVNYNVLRVMSGMAGTAYSN